MSNPSGTSSDDDAVEHAHDGSTVSADEGDPDGAAFAGGEKKPDASSEAASDQDGHGYGYE